MNRNLTLLSRIFKNPKEINLGRWGVVSDQGKGVIADLANEDHCGPCGNKDDTSAVQKLVEINKRIDRYRKLQEKKNEDEKINEKINFFGESKRFNRYTKFKDILD